MQEEGELSRSPSTSFDDFAHTLRSVEDVMDDLAMKVERARGEANTRDELELIERLQGHLSTMQSVSGEFMEKRKQSSPNLSSKLEVFVGNTKHVLKTEEDVYNYFVR